MTKELSKMTALATIPTNDIAVYQEISRDIVTEFLATKRSKATRKAYEGDIKRYFRYITGQEVSPDILAWFFNNSRKDALSFVLSYKSHLQDSGLASATINRRMSAIRSLCEYAYLMEIIDWQLPRLTQERVQSFRDTTGVELEQIKAMMAVPDRDTVQGKRDYSILRLLWENGLRRGELANIKLDDISWDTKKISIIGKGRGNDKTEIDVSQGCLNAIASWLEARPVTDDPHLFVSLSNRSKAQLSTTSIYKIIRATAEKAGIEKVISPHRIRHSAITAYLDATDGDIRGACVFARHSSINMTQKYDDNRKQLQKKATTVLADIA